MDNTKFVFGPGRYLAAGRSLCFPGSSKKAGPEGVVTQIGIPSMERTAENVKQGAERTADEHSARENDTWKWQVGGNDAPHGENDAPLCGGIQVHSSRPTGTNMSHNHPYQFQSMH